MGDFVARAYVSIAIRIVWLWDATVRGLCSWIAPLIGAALLIMGAIGSAITHSPGFNLLAFIGVLSMVTYTTNAIINTFFQESEQ